MNSRAVSMQGLGYGALAVATFGFITESQGYQPEVSDVTAIIVYQPSTQMFSVAVLAQPSVNAFLADSSQPLTVGEAPMADPKQPGVLRQVVLIALQAPPKQTLLNVTPQPAVTALPVFPSAQPKPTTTLVELT